MYILIYIYIFIYIVYIYIYIYIYISRAITTESSPLHIVSSRTRTGNL